MQASATPHHEVVAMLQMSIEEPAKTLPKTGQSTSGLTGIHSRMHERGAELEIIRIRKLESLQVTDRNQRIGHRSLTRDLLA